MRILMTTSFALIAVGCNSGRSNSAPAIAAAPPAVAQPEITINADNALTVAQAGVRGSLDLMRLGYIGAHFLQTPMPEPAGAEPSQPSGLATLQSTTVDGPEGGIATFTWDDIDEDGAYTSGDVFTVSFDEYGDEGMLLNGVMTIDNVDLQGLLPGDGTYLLAADLNFVGLSVTLGSTELTISTTLPFHVENRILIEIFELTLPENKLIGSFEVLRDTRLLRYETSETLRFQFDGAVRSSDLGGTVRFSTPTFLVGSPFLSDPTAGTLVMSGFKGTSVEIEPNCIVPGVCFSLDVRVDEDGDGEYDVSLSSSWAGLLP